MTISPEARAAAQSFSVGSGYNSVGKSFDQVRQDMRTLLDTRTRETGETLTTSTRRPQIQELLGDITDRRALFAVFGDKTGAFTEAEKQAMFDIMWYEGAKVVYQGVPQELFDRLTPDPTNERFDEEAIDRASKLIGPKTISSRAVKYLDRGSPEEKASLEWIENRAYHESFISDETINTGDRKVDDLIFKLTEEMLKIMKKMQKNGDEIRTIADYRTLHIDPVMALLLDSEVYKQVEKDLQALHDSGHFTSALEAKPASPPADPKTTPPAATVSVEV